MADQQRLMCEVCEEKPPETEIEDRMGRTAEVCRGCETEIALGWLEQAEEAMPDG